MTTTLVTPKVMPPGAMTAKDAAGKDGLNLVVFGYGGCGKTTLIANAQDSEAGKDVFIIDTDKGMKSLGDREDVVVWRGPDPENKPLVWEDIIRIIDWLKRTEHSYRTIGFDSVTAAYRLCLAHVMKSSPTPDMPSQPEYGKANELILAAIRDMKESFSVRKGWNVIISAHAEEMKDESTGTVLIRMAITPGVVKGIYQIVDAVGYLAASPKDSSRKLLLKNSARVVAKYRQPQTGPQVPLEIDNPNLGLILEHTRGIRTFPQKG